MELKEKIEAFVREALEDPQYFIVDVITSKSGRTISVLLDGDAGIPIDVCGKVSRAVSARIDEEIPDEVGAFTVEVSSPGVDRPLKQLRQLPKHVGRSLVFTDGQGTRHEGVLKEVRGEALVLEETFKEKGKKKEVRESEYIFEQLSDPRVVVSFK